MFKNRRIMMIHEISSEGARDGGSGATSLREHAEVGGKVLMVR